jgi:hypothetical protein
MATTKKRRLTDEERDRRRAQDRETARRAVEALQRSVGWQQWLQVRRRLHSYGLVILRRRVGLRLIACWRHVADGACGRRRPTGGR